MSSHGKRYSNFGISILTVKVLFDEVDLIPHFGSRLRKETHKYSDLDLCYILTNESTWNHITVLVEETLIDLFAIHWFQFEENAQFGHINCTILLNSEIVYRLDEEAARRFAHFFRHGGGAAGLFGEQVSRYSSTDRYPNRVKTAVNQSPIHQ